MDRAPSPTASALVGRDRERGLIDAVLDEAASGHAGTLVVHGEAGVGKTALVNAATAGRTDGLSLYGAGLPLSSLTVPLLAVRSLVRGLPDGVPSLELPTGNDVSEAVVRVDAWLDTLASAGPVALVLDDLHWADQTSLDILQYVVAGPEHRRLTVLATVRSGAVTDAHPLTRWLADVRRLPRVEEIVLAPLDKEATLDQLTNLLGETPHGSLVDEVYARTGGNPYFTRLLAAGLPSDARSLPAAMPESLHGALLRTSSTLSETARRGTQVLAVGGHPMTYDELDEAAPDLGWDAVVPEAIAAGVVDALPGGRLWIHHPLLAETLEAELPARERRARHRAFARWWEARPPSGEESAEAARIAHVADHYFQARDADEARTWALRAARAAESAGMWSEAQRLLERELARGSASGADEARRDLLHRTQHATEMSGDIETELRLIEELLALIDPEDEPLAVAELLIRRTYLRFHTGQKFDDTDALELAEALARSRPPSATLVRVLSWRVMNGRWKTDRNVEVSEEALAIAHEIGEAVGVALAGRTMAAVFGDDAATAIACGTEAMETGVREGDWLTAQFGAKWSADADDNPWSPWYAERVARARAYLMEAGAPPHVTLTFAVLEADARLYMGEWEEGVALTRACLAGSMTPMWDAGARLGLARLAVLQGRPSEALAHLARAEELIADAPRFAALEFDAIRAMISLSVGDVEAAYVHALNGLRWETQAPTMVEYLVPLAARALADQVERRRAGGEDVDNLLQRVDELAGSHPHIELEEREMRPWWAAEAETFQVMYRAELARARQSEDACLLWRVTTIRARRARLAWDEAYAGWRWAEALLRSGQHGRETATVLRDAHRLALRLAAVPVVEALERLAAGAHIPLTEVMGHPDGAPAEAPFPGLTAREREILTYLVAGRTYAEIAEALVISEKTVSSHVSNILRKTGARNRVELAVLADQRRTPGAASAR